MSSFAKHAKIALPLAVRYNGVARQCLKARQGVAVPEFGVVLSGKMTVIVEGKDTVLGPMDSWTIAPSEVREIVNRQNDICKVLAVIPHRPGARA